MASIIATMSVPSGSDSYPNTAPDLTTGAPTSPIDEIATSEVVPLGIGTRETTPSEVAETQVAELSAIALSAAEFPFQPSTTEMPVAELLGPTPDLESAETTDSTLTVNPTPELTEGVRPRRPVGLIVATCLLSLFLTGALGLTAYLWHAAGAWREDSAAWEAQARTQGEYVAELQAQLAATTWELDGARSQLATATRRITELADEKAQMGDAYAVTEQYLDFQRRVSEAAGVVAQAMARCIDGQSQLIEFERNSERYDPNDLQRFANQVNALCVQARDANTQLQTELNQ